MPKIPGEKFGALLEMETIVRLLNSDDDHDGQFPVEARNRLRRTVRAWFESGPNLNTMHKYQHRKDPTFQQMRSSVEAYISGHPNGRAQLTAVPALGYDPANYYFVALAMNPECLRLALPCENTDCKSWYLKTRLGESRFCSRYCADRTKLTTRRAYAKKRKLERVKAALANWPIRPPRHKDMGWKEWLRLAEPNITANFVTRAITKKEVTPPVS